MLLKLINTCIFDESGIFCSSIYKDNASQYFKIIVIHFLGNSLKLCSNISYFLFALSRLIIINSSHQRIITQSVRISSTRKKRYGYFFVFILIFFICSLLSLFKLFQYRLNVDKDYRKDFPYELRDELYCNSSSGEYKCMLFSSFKIANSILNDVCMVVLNIIIDIVLIRRLHRHLEEKTSLTQIVTTDYHKNIKKTKKRVNRMVFLNSCLYIISHLPEFLTTLLLIVYSTKIAKFCMFNFSCDLINEEAEFFSLISISCQFFIYRVFDRNFKASFDDLKARVLCCFRENKNGASNVTNSIGISSIELRNLNKLIGDGRID